MKGFNSEMIESAKSARSVEELREIAKANHMELTAEEAAVYYAQLNPAQGELNDDELDNVAGGACAEDTRGDHVQLPGGTCPYCGANNPSGYYNFRGGHNGFTYFMERLDCCGNTMNLGHSELEQLIELG